MGALLAAASASFLPPFVARYLWAESFVTDGPSMEPTLSSGDRFVVDRTAIGLFPPGAHESLTTWGELVRGDVVVVNSPMDGVDIIKRVIGVGGDRVEIHADDVFVNGMSLRVGEAADCPHSGDPETTACYEERSGERRWRVASDRWDVADMAEREVPPGTVFLLGDHRSRSNDSRNPLVGMVPLSHVVGVVRFRYWSESGAPTGWIE